MMDNVERTNNADADDEETSGLMTSCLAAREQASILPHEPQALDLFQLQKLFERLCSSMWHVSLAKYGPADPVDICDDIRQALDRYPVLAMVQDSGTGLDPSQDKGKTMLAFLICSPLIRTGPGRELLTFLLQKNPHALAWEWVGEHREEAPQEDGESETDNFILLQWHWNTLKFVSRFHPRLVLDTILPAYPWIMDHSNIQKRPPHMELLFHYTQGTLDAQDMLRFFQSYPHLLHQEASYSEEYFLPEPVSMPLALAIDRLGHSTDPLTEQDKALWDYMLQESPSTITTVQEEDTNRTLINKLAAMLSNFASQDMDVKSIDIVCKLCRKLVDQDPHSVFCADTNGWQPLDYLADVCHISKIQDLAALVIRHGYALDHPGMAVDCDDLGLYFGIYKLIQKEAAIFLERVRLQKACGCISEKKCRGASPTKKVSAAAQISNEEKAGRIFQAWAKNRLKPKFSSLPRVRDIRQREFVQLKKDHIQKSSQPSETDN